MNGHYHWPKWRYNIPRYSNIRVNPAGTVNHQANGPLLGKEESPKVLLKRWVKDCLLNEVM